VASGKVHDDLARVHVRHQCLHHLRQGVIRHGEDEKVARPGYLGRRSNAYAGQKCLSPHSRDVAAG
jgi:hypothetical protein